MISKSVFTYLYVVFFSNIWHIWPNYQHYYGCYLGNDISKLFCVWNSSMSIHISLKFIPRSPLNNKPSLIERMACRLTGNKASFETITTKAITKKILQISLLTHICVSPTRWFNHSLSIPCLKIIQCSYYCYVTMSKEVNDVLSDTMAHSSMICMISV